MSYFWNKFTISLNNVTTSLYFLLQNYNLLCHNRNVWFNICYSKKYISRNWCLYNRVHSIFQTWNLNVKISFRLKFLKCGKRYEECLVSGRRGVDIWLNFPLYFLTILQFYNFTHLYLLSHQTTLPPANDCLGAHEQGTGNIWNISKLILGIDNARNKEHHVRKRVNWINFLKIKLDFIKGQ